MKLKSKITRYSHWSMNFINVMWWKLLILFGVNRSPLPIPEGIYCYSPDTEKNEKAVNFKYYYVKPCKYYKTLGNRYNGCSYLGIITDDSVFNDQCKMCGENYGLED